ncbi:unnamed protein product [Linum tenue]|uniref:Uncharacterized protein n=2 Tax=Linum tenue TaxID=586396 RepID=A0AAV0LHN2_9ROSI|nr:unnamed protein product [Linum tenue]
MAKVLVSLAVVGLAISLFYRVVAQDQEEASSTPSSYVPLLVLGDSLVDSGNNNYLDTTFRADSPPYGIDSPTGRFSNGRNFADYISEVLGLPEPPSPHLSPQFQGERLLYGANFASGGVGILNDTGSELGNIIRMPEQLASFERYQAQLAALVGGTEQARRLVNRAMVLLALGTEDFVRNYFTLPFSARARQYTPRGFIDYLISEYVKILQRLFELGARRVLVVGPGRIGCVPAQLAGTGRDEDVEECTSEIENAALLFNSELARATQQMNSQLQTDVYVAANTYMISLFSSNFPVEKPGSNHKVACCGQGPYNGEGQCTPASNLCPNRDEYVFWDSYHPTERAIATILEFILDGPPEFMSPMNLNTMLALNNET